VVNEVLSCEIKELQDLFFKAPCDDQVFEEEDAKQPSSEEDEPT